MSTLLDKFKEVRPNLVYDPKVKRGVISGTDIGAIMGYNPYSTAYDVWLKRKYGFITPADNSYIRAGLNLEDVVAKKYYGASRKDCKIYKGKYLKLKDTNFVGTPDFIINKRLPPFTEIWTYGLEIKTAASNWLEIPSHYKLQCHWYMMLTGFKHWDLAALLEGHTYREYKLEYDEPLEKEMISEANAFNDKHLFGDEEPFDMLCQQKSTKVDYVPTIDSLIAHRNSHKKSMDIAEQMLKETEATLKALIAEREGVKSDNYLVTWKTQSRETIDYKKILEDYGVDIESYKKQGEGFRVLRVKAL